MKKIGDSQHTLILLDFALALPERRRLARKSKSMLGNKLFAVVDRTVMMFLVRNFNENQINRMLISLITPFGYYQPYVWDSANVMPPEIFMGRKKELEQIKSATGVNIVYGGRQLGKSALLRKAKEEIDQDEIMIARSILISRAEIIWKLLKKSVTNCTTRTFWKKISIQLTGMNYPVQSSAACNLPLLPLFLICSCFSMKPIPLSTAVKP